MKKKKKRDGLNIDFVRVNYIKNIFSYLSKIFTTQKLMVIIIMIVF